MAINYNAVMEERAEQIRKFSFPKEVLDMGITKELLLTTYEDSKGETRYRYGDIIRAITDGQRASRVINVDVFGNYKPIVLKGVVDFQTGNLQAIFASRKMDRKEVLTGSKTGKADVLDFWDKEENVKMFQEKGKLYCNGKNLAKFEDLTDTLKTLLTQRYAYYKTGNKTVNNKDEVKPYPVFNPVAVRVGIEPVVNKETGEVKAGDYRIVPFVKGMENVGFLTLGPDNQAHVLKADTLEKRLLRVAEDGTKTLGRSDKLFKGITLDVETATRLVKYGVAPVVAANEEKGTHYPMVLTFDNNGNICQADYQNPIAKQLMSEGWEMVKEQFPKEDIAQAEAEVKAAEESVSVEGEVDETKKAPTKKAPAKKAAAEKEQKPSSMKKTR